MRYILNINRYSHEAQRYNFGAIRNILFKFLSGARFRLVDMTFSWMSQILSASARCLQVDLAFVWLMEWHHQLSSPSVIAVSSHSLNYVSHVKGVNTTAVSAPLNKTCLVILIGL